MKAPRNTDLKSLDEILKLGGLTFGVCDLLLQEFQVPNFPVYVTLRCVLDPISLVPLGQGSNHNSLSFDNRF